MITLDADTRLPRGAVNRLVGTLAHPLNRPAFDPAPRPCRRGLRRAPAADHAHDARRSRGSLFQRIFSGPAGLDPYAAAVSDVYQDLFGEGSYTGKGIYDVDAFEAALAGRVPDNALLSHDLFEGIFARAGLVTDVELFEEFPIGLRGGRRPPAPVGARRLATAALDPPRRRATATHPARIPLIGRWKMLDNLRQDAVGAGRLLTLVAGWTLPHTEPLVWTVFVLVIMALPALLSPLSELIPGAPGNLQAGARARRRAELRDRAVPRSASASRSSRIRRG